MLSSHRIQHGDLQNGSSNNPGYRIDIDDFGGYTQVSDDAETNGI